ncbi:MAG: ABC transporter permease [Clostridiales bacterium]|nr:ABC transporter permease [Clostridiales bacterium]MDU1042460.1 ABC transporter permease [Clostridiales bacterium]MDU3489753.1 ABC transporter permease [Clostridiales bacterium]
MMDCIKPSNVISKQAGKVRRRVGNRISPRTRLIIWSSVVIGLLVFVIFSPRLAPYDPYAIDLKNTLTGPSELHRLGTDYIGRDIFSRILHGGYRSIYSALAVVLITAGTGTVVGILCGYIGGAFDTIVMRITDSFQAFPSLIFTIAVAAMLGGGLLNAIIAMSAIGWTGYARLARSSVITIKEKNYVKAALITGSSKTGLLFRTILPNAMSSIIVMASMSVSNKILAFAGLSYLGLGTAKPFPEWGAMLNDGQETLQIAPWAVIYPGAAIFIVVIIMGMFGDSVNEYLNPDKKK